MEGYDGKRRGDGMVKVGVHSVRVYKISNFFEKNPIGQQLNKTVRYHSKTRGHPRTT